MKSRIIFFSSVALISVLFHSCMTELSIIPAESSYFGIDFTKYSRAGFLITPEKYLDDYESVGIVNYVVIPSAEYRATTKVSYTKTDGSTVLRKVWYVNKVSFNTGLDSLHAIAKRYGADAIINFSWTPTQRNYQSIKNPVVLEGYSISGFAIKRKKHD